MSQVSPVVTGTLLWRLTRWRTFISSPTFHSAFTSSIRSVIVGTLLEKLVFSFPNFSSLFAASMRSASFQVVPDAGERGLEIRVFPLSVRFPFVVGLLGFVGLRGFDERAAQRGFVADHDGVDVVVAAGELEGGANFRIVARDALVEIAEVVGVGDES